MSLHPEWNEAESHLLDTARRARVIVDCVAKMGTLRGCIGENIREVPCSLRRLADHGVPDNLDLPFDSPRLRSLVRELAQIAVD